MSFIFVHLLVGIFTFAFSAIFTLVAVYAERKIAGFIQDRLGPTETGKYGCLQTVADILKLVQKEFILPTNADKWFFLLAPILIFMSVYLGFATMPWSVNLVGAKLNLGIFYVFAILSIETLGILMAGWSSNNKYALLGAIRSVGQIISYEIPTAVALISAIMMAQSLNLQHIAIHQGLYATEKIYFFGVLEVNAIGGVLAWHIFQAPHLIIAFIIFFIGSLAECNRTPFDLPEAESELVAGFHVEYSGLRFAFIFLAEYSMMFLVSMLGTIVFLGGWNSPLPNMGNIALATWTNGTIWGIFWIMVKSLILVFLQIWVRWTLPRFRIDQLMSFCWKVLIPISFACLFISGIWRVLLVS